MISIENTSGEWFYSVEGSILVTWISSMIWAEMLKNKQDWGREDGERHTAFFHDAPRRWHTQSTLQIIKLHLIQGASLVAQLVKNLPAVWETWVQSPGREDPLEKERATHSSIAAWRIPWTEKSGRLQSMGSQRVGQDWVTNTFTSSYSWR